ncbi:hypothetical protein SAMN04515695_2529 [Pseudovibrio sp. Tun.PSC04-5.I4]|nr:hypothetical protein SAMN04515695_2529 [Pseudovibrio sp. Tun.PSC04-5.I4]
MLVQILRIYVQHVRQNKAVKLSVEALKICERHMRVWRSFLFMLLGEFDMGDVFKPCVDKLEGAFSIVFQHHIVPRIGNGLVGCAIKIG